MAHFRLSDRLGRGWVFFRPAPLQIHQRAAELSPQWAAGSFLRSFAPADLRSLAHGLCGLGTTLDRMSDEAVVERLERDMASGWLVVCDPVTAEEAIEADHALLASVLRPPAEPEPDSAGPGGARAEERTWFEVQVVDELGEPISGLSLVVEADGKRDLTTDGAGTVRLDEVTAGYGWARIEDLDGLRELVRSRWDEVREGEWLEPAPDHTFMPLRGDEPIQVSLLSETPHTIVVQPWVVRARLLGLYFETNKCFLLPLANDDVASIKGIYERNHPAALLCVGHTDISGDPPYNDPLSLERADAVAAYLRDQVTSWLDWYGGDRPWEKRWGLHEDQLMLSVMPDRESQGESEPDVIWYQRTRRLEVDGDVGTETRKALIAEYMARDGAELPSDVELGTHGCGESFPLSESEVAELVGEAAPSDEASKQLCRRVELYFFDHKLGVQPPPPGTVSPADSTACSEWERRARETYDYLHNAQELLIRLLDADDAPLEALQWSLAAGRSTFAGVTGHDGLVRTVIPKDAATAELLAAGRRHSLALLTRHTFPPASTVAGAQLRLKNLAYDPGPLSSTLTPETQHALCAFQFDHDLDATGQLDTETANKLLQVYGS